MAHEIINALRAKSTIRVVGNTATTITLADLSVDANVETVTEAAIAQVSATTDGVWRIYRGNNTSGELILEIPHEPTSLKKNTCACTTTRSPYKNSRKQQSATRSWSSEKSYNR